MSLQRSFWHNLEEGQKFIRWESDFGLYSAVVVSVTSVWPSRNGFDADVTQVGELELVHSKKSWGRTDCPLLVPLPQSVYDEVFSLVSEARMKVHELLCKAKVNVPSYPHGGTCFVLHNSSYMVSFGRFVLGISKGNWRITYKKSQPVLSSNVEVDLMRMTDTRLSCDRVVFPIFGLMEHSLFYISTQTYNKAKGIRDGYVKSIKRLLTPFFVPVMKRGRWGFSDRNKGFELPCVWKAVVPFYNEYAAVMNNEGKWGFIDRNGMMCVPCEWARVEKFETSMTFVYDFEDYRYLMSYCGENYGRLEYEND